MKKLRDFKKGFINLELEGQGRGIIMGLTSLLLLGLFYTIQTKRDQTLCTRVCIDWNRSEKVVKILQFFQFLHYIFVRLKLTLSSPSY